MTDSDTTASTETLIRLLERQDELIDQLAQLADRQGALIEAGRTQALLVLLSRRQEIMDQFVNTQDRLVELSESLRGEGRLSGVRRDRIGGLISRITSRLSQIMRRDEQDRNLLKVNRDQTREEMAGLAHGTQARHAYVRPGTASNRFADRLG